MRHRPCVSLALVVLSGCVDLSRPASLASVEVVDAAIDVDPEEPDGPTRDGEEGDALVEPDTVRTSDGQPPDGPAPDARSPDVLSGAEVPPPDAVAADAPPDSGGCTTEAQCESGYSCINQVCGALPGLALHWTLDETSGTQAADASGNSFHGTYGGATGTPATSTSVPTMQFPDPASRSFVGTSRQEVRLTSLPAICGGTMTHLERLVPRHPGHRQQRLRRDCQHRRWPAYLEKRVTKLRETARLFAGLRPRREVRGPRPRPAHGVEHDAVGPAQPVAAVPAGRGHEALQGRTLASARVPVVR